MMRSLLAKLLGAATLSATLLLSPLTASAQPKDAKACPDKNKAKKDFVKGRLAYRRGDYEEAIILWQDSYASCAKPLTLYNIGNAYERMGDLEAALKHFEQYRPVAPKHEQADLDSRMAGLRTRIAENKKAAADQQAKDDAAAQAEKDRKAREDWERRQREQNKGGGIITIIGWSAVGVGGAAIIAGVVMDAVASSKRPDEAQACTDASGRLLCRDSQRDDIESSNTLALAGDITWIAGSVFAAGGATMLILQATGILTVGGGGGDASSKRAPKASITIAPYGAGLQAFGSF